MAFIEAVASPIDPIARVVYGFDGQTPNEEERSTFGEIVVPLQEVSLEPPLLNEITPEGIHILLCLLHISLMRTFFPAPSASSAAAGSTHSAPQPSHDWEEVENGTRKGTIVMLHFIFFMPFIYFFLHGLFR